MGWISCQHTRRTLCGDKGSATGGWKTDNTLRRLSLYRRRHDPRNLFARFGKKASSTTIILIMEKTHSLHMDCSWNGHVIVSPHDNNSPSSMLVFMQQAFSKNLVFLLHVVWRIHFEPSIHHGKKLILYWSTVKATGWHRIPIIPSILSILDSFSAPLVSALYWLVCQLQIGSVHFETAWQTRIVQNLGAPNRSLHDILLLEQDRR